MKKVINIILAFSMIISIISSININALAASNENYQYSVRNSEVIITKYIGSAKDVIIPEEIGGKPVTVIDKNAFYSKRITSVVMPDTVKTIDECAFQFCDELTSVKFSNNLESIGEYAFYECTELKTLILPPSLKTIGAGALVCSSSLKYLFIPESVTSIDKEGIGFRRVFIYVNDDDPFTKPITNFVVYGYSGSAAEKYAADNGFKFEDVSNAFNLDAKGVSLRITSPGMRFGFQINSLDEFLFSSAYSLELGFLYTYSDNKDSLTLENSNTNGIYKKVATNTIAADSNISYNLVFTNIPKNSYDTKISARAYAIINGITFYSDVKSYSVNEVINLIMADEQTEQNIKDKIKSTFMI